MLFVVCKTGRSDGSVGNLETFVGTLVRISVQSHELGFFLTKKKKVKKINMEND